MISDTIFVGLPGPTHNFGGLSQDNVAAVTNRGSASNPRQAALQALDLMELLLKLDQRVAVLPPQLRPHIPLLKTKFSGSDEKIIQTAAKESPQLLEQASSSAFMWAANAATATPACDSQDKKLHLTPANLHTHPHRRIEAEATHHILKQIFARLPNAMIHPPVDASAGMLDEGAANHMRLAPAGEGLALHVFVHGDAPGARQSRKAFEHIAATHVLPTEQAIHLTQHSDCIARGVFHNDVIAISHDHFLLCHEHSYANGAEDIHYIAQEYGALYPGMNLHAYVVRADELSIDEAVRTYFFNSQIVTLKSGKMALIAPSEVKETPKANALAERIQNDPKTPIEEIHYVDLRQSMKNGGGPACLRLRVPMSEEEFTLLRETTKVVIDAPRLARLRSWVVQNYPEFLTGADLGNPQLLRQCRSALIALGDIIGLDTASSNP